MTDHAAIDEEARRLVDYVLAADRADAVAVVRGSLVAALLRGGQVEIPEGSAMTPEDARIAELRAEVERLTRERDDYRSKWCWSVGVANECVKGVKAAEARVAELEAIQRIAHVQVDGDGDLWLHLDGGKNYKASVNVSAKFATHRGVVHGGVRQAAEALRALPRHGPAERRDV